MRHDVSEIFGILFTTTDAIEGYTITDVCGLVESTSTIGTGFLSESLISVADFLGTSSMSIEKKMSKAKNDALLRIAIRANMRKCNAVVGLRFEINEISSNGRMVFMITAYGTAIKCEKNDPNDGINTVSGQYLYRKIFEIPTYQKQLESISIRLKKQDQTGVLDFKNIINELLKMKHVESLEEKFMICLLDYALFYENENIITEAIKDLIQFFQQEQLSDAYLKYMLDLSSNKTEILRFKKIKSYNSICEIFSSIIPLRITQQYLLTGNDYFGVIVLYPLLLVIKDNYSEEDIEVLYGLTACLKSRYWNESIDILDLYSFHRICICGSVLSYEEQCKCNDCLSISTATYKIKKQIINQLTELTKELERIYRSLR